jgi:hypothetical protein
MVIVEKIENGQEHEENETLKEEGNGEKSDPGSPDLSGCLWIPWILAAPDVSYGSWSILMDSSGSYRRFKDTH